MTTDTTKTPAMAAKPTLFTPFAAQVYTTQGWSVNTSACCELYCAQTGTEPEDVLIHWIAHEFQMPTDLRHHLQYSKLEVLTAQEFWQRVEQGLALNITLNNKLYSLHLQSSLLVLRTAAHVAVSYRQYCGMRFAVAHVWNAIASTGVKSQSRSWDSPVFGDPLASFPSIRPTEKE
jgi:hypothetical protein